MANVLIIGAGGREMAIAYALIRSPQDVTLFSWPGSDGLALISERIDAEASDIVLQSKARGIDLVVFGGETELVAGLSDEFRAAGLLVFGPSQAAAALEGSKDFLKSVLFDAGVPCARSESFTDIDAAKAYLATRSAPIVLKTDGLAGGKGVVICETLGEAESWLERYLSGEAFGAAGQCVIIEDFLEGDEISFFVLVDADGNAHPLAASRDHKRIFDNDQGPNTGGMGAFTPVAEFTPELQAQVMAEIIEPSLAEMKRRGTPFSGFLFAGLMLTDQGPMLLEYNIRLGDPETQVILPAIEGDFFEMLRQASKGAMRADYKIDTQTARINVVLAAKGYPESPEKGAQISGLDGFALGQDYLHAGTKHEAGAWLVNGGRVLNILGEGASIDAARADVYAKARQISFEAMQIRSDIGEKT